MENNSQLSHMIEKLEKSNRQQVNCARLQLAFSAAAFLLCLVLVLTVMKVLPQVMEIAGRADAVLGNLETVTEELAQMDVQGMVENVDGLVGDVDDLVTSTREGLEDTLDAVGKINFETLNQAIEDLAEVIEPLANFFNMFDR